jgi:DNA mismatch endonuclease (patch repair protein)
MTGRKRIRKGVPEASSEEVARRMRTTGRRDTAPEVSLRSKLHRLGLRYRVDKSPIRGVRRRADVVFGSAGVAVFVDGCFWHGCPVHSTWPKRNAVFWRDKIETNQRRDADTDRRLKEAGWLPIRVWEHEDPTEATARIAAAVRTRRSNRPVH